MVKGLYLYAPPNVVEELDAIMARKKIIGRKKRAIAFKEMAKYSKIGREAESILSLRFD